MSDTKLVKNNTIRRFLPVQSIITALIVIFLFYAFFSGLTYQFYASVLFLFYSLTQKMWVSVMLLGVFQTFLMIPFRIVRLIKSNNIKEFQESIDSLGDQRKMQSSIKANVSKGNFTFLFYLVDFVVQLVSFITIGRMFLTDFYSYRLDPKMLYSFVPYPEYPIQDTFFKLPYPVITETRDLGLQMVLVVWLVLIALQVAIFFIRSFYRRSLAKGNAQQFSKKITRYTSGYLVIGLLISALIVRNFPLGFEIAIFSGDVSIPNQKLNTITALATFFMVVWFGIQNNIRKAKMAEEAGVEVSLIEQTQKEMFKETLKSSILLGLGAYLITNQIPSAFELSIFTLEVISLASPLTLDKLILSATSKKNQSDEENSAEVN